MTARTVRSARYRPPSARTPSSRRTTAIRRTRWALAGHRLRLVDGDEEVTVTGTAALSTAQDWLPNDTATLTGDTNLTGTLTFQLYTGNNCGATSGSAVAGKLYTVPVSNAASGSTFSTSNTTFKVKAADSGNYSWLVTYDDANLEDPDPECETTAITITD